MDEKITYSTFTQKDLLEFFEKCKCDIKESKATNNNEGDSSANK